MGGMIKNVAKSVKFGENMEKTKSIDSLVLVFSITIISFALVSLFFDKFISFSMEKSSKKVISEYPENYPFKFKQGQRVYNFDKMIALLAKYRSLEREFYANYEAFIKNPDNIKRVDTLLTSIKNEKVAYKNYLKRIKLYHSKPRSTKKRDSLIYYRRVLEAAVRELKDMSLKFRVNNGL